MNPQTISECLHVNNEGHLCIGGCDAVSLAETYGTPLYVMDEATIRTALRSFRESLMTHYDGHGTIAYASKACSFKEMYRIVNDEQCSADVVSCGEMYTAIMAGFPAERLFFHGNNNTAADLKMALSYGIGRIIVDNTSELHRLSAIAEEMGKTAQIYLRITPGIDAHTHDFVKTGQVDCKFGFTLENGDAMLAVKEALATPHVELKGLHCHVGSQIFDEKPFAHAAQVMLDFMNAIRKECGATLPELNLGGGFGIKYLESDAPMPPADYIELAVKTVKEYALSLDYPLPYLVFEPGRSIVASAGVTLYTVGHVKHIPGVRTYVSMDGGMADNPRYALYQADYTAVIANKADKPADQTVTIAGRCCESGDLLQENTMLQSCEEGDVLAVLATGAYNYSMASHYNRLPNPAVVMVKDGGSRVVVKGETLEDLIKNDL